MRVVPAAAGLVAVVVLAVALDEVVAVADAAGADGDGDELDELLPHAAVTSAIGARSNASDLRMEPKTSGRRLRRRV